MSKSQLKCHQTILFQTIQYVNKVKGFQILQNITNSLIKHQSFVSTQLNDQNSSILNNQFSMSTKLNGSNYCYASLTIQLTIIIFLSIVKWINNSISSNSV